MAKIRGFETPADDYGFVGTHILDGGKLLSHIRLAMLDEREYHGNLAKLGVQIGRCGGGKAAYDRNRGCKRAWAWKRGTATLGEMRCPACGEHLSQTSLALKSIFWVIEPGAVRVIATDTLHRERARAYELLEAHEGKPDGNEFTVRNARERIEKANARLRKVQRNPRQKAVA